MKIKWGFHPQTGSQVTSTKTHVAYVVEGNLMGEVGWLAQLFKFPGGFGGAPHPYIDRYEKRELFKTRDEALDQADQWLREEQ